MARCKGCVHDKVCNRDVGHGYSICPHYINAADVAPRAELAREILEEIEKYILENCCVVDDDVDRIWKHIAELKKKYTGG